MTTGSSAAQGVSLERREVLRKGTKYAIYFALSFLIANTLLAYIIGTDALGRIITDPPSQHSRRA